MHLKFRPTTMDEVIGLTHIKKSLANFKYDVPIMFCGERGCGKTTLAEILASNFATNSYSIHTINCGYYSKIDDMRAEIDKLYNSSLFGKKRVLILDEIHRLSDASQNAWLIPLEKLPENVLVIACTTEPSKVIKTLLRRFREYYVARLSIQESKTLIDKVLAEEDLSVPKWAKVKVIEKSDGIPGLILTALPKVVGITDEAEVDFLLEILATEQDAEALNVLKCIIGNLGWGAIKKALSTSLRETKPESVRVSLMQLISGRMMSDYATNNYELNKLGDFYDNLQKAQGYPERANLVNAVYKAFYAFYKTRG